MRLSDAERLGAAAGHVAGLWGEGADGAATGLGMQKVGLTTDRHSQTQGCTSAPWPLRALSLHLRSGGSSRSHLGAMAVKRSALGP